LAVIHVPEKYLLVETPARQPRAVGAERYRPDIQSMSREGSSDITPFDIP
jgi:hypothetical protein